MPPKKTANREANIVVTGKNLYQPDPPAANPEVHTLLKPLRIVADKDFRVKLKDKKSLGGLVDRPPKFTNAGTSMMDGRMRPIALVVLRDKKGATKPGIEVQLLDAATNALLDLSRTDANGVVLLRFPMGPGKRDKEIKGIVQLSDGSKNVNIAVPPMPKQHVVVQFLLEDVNVLSVPQFAADNPLARLHATLPPTCVTPSHRRFLHSRIQSFRALQEPATFAHNARRAIPTLPLRAPSRIRQSALNRIGDSSCACCRNGSSWATHWARSPTLSRLTLAACCARL